MFTILLKYLGVDLSVNDLPNLTENEHSLICRFIETTRHLMEIETLFRIFRFNHNNIFHLYTIYNTDRFERTISNDYKVNDDIIINSLTINYISSGKTLVDTIEAFISAMYDEEELTKFKSQYISIEFDSCFSYRFLYHMRNFCQHGHFIVSTYPPGYFCFDLNQIIKTPHFNFKNFKGELEAIITDIYEKYEDNPYLHYIKTISAYDLSVLKIYNSFFEYVTNNVESIINQIKTLIQCKPEIVRKSNDELNGMILYMYDTTDETIHAFNPEADSLGMFQDFKTYAKAILNSQLEHWNKNIQRTKGIELNK